jgi:hypothetical protein
MFLIMRNLRERSICVAIGVVLCLLLMHFCERRGIKEDKVVTKIKVVKVNDTLRVKGGVTTKFKNVYVRKTDTSIVYLDKPDSTSICANYYEQPIIGKRSNGTAFITTTGELIDFKAIIECTDTIKETTITKYRDRSRLFLSPSYNTNNQINLGVDWNLKNKVLLKGGVGYDINNTAPYLSIGLGIPIF